MKTGEIRLQRREFVKNSAVATGVVMLCGCSSGPSREGERAGTGAGDDAGTQREQLLED